MIDIATETLCPIGEAPRHIPGRPHLATVYRWFQKGVRGGIKLETALVGGKRFTSHQAVQRFVDRLSGPGDVMTGSTPTDRKKASSKANEELAKAGW